MGSNKESGPRFVSVGGSGAALQLVPPFGFEGVTMRTFPLRASLPKLTKFVDSYLNIIPPEVGYFRPFLPYVYLMIINYGKMAVEAANMGWIAQNEIAFSIGLEWYKKKDGVLKFHDFAYVSPFIYVDNDLSMTTGREVYGWPKSLISLTPEVSTWMENPRKGPRLATVSAMVFPEVYSGCREELRPLLQIEHAPVPSFTQFPPDLSSPIYPWSSIPNAIRGSASMLGDLGRIIGGLGLTRQKDESNPKGYADMVALLAKNLNPYKPNLYFNTINLKQFRDSGVPGAFCYQAVTNAPMSLVKFNAGGMLGDMATALGDPSGGYRILMHKWPTQPIVDGLGLVVEREWDGNGATVAELRPVLPLWLDVDMEYATGKALAWRTRDDRLGWTLPGEQATAQGSAVATPPEARVLPVAAPHAAPPASIVPEGEAELFNTSLGTSLDLTGPFDFPSTTLRVLPLLADPDKLLAFCDGYLNEELKSAGHRFVPWGHYVYLVATSYEEMASESNNVGSWADNDVVFYVPVKWYHRVGGKDGKDGKKEELRTVALLPVFAFADGSTVAITRSEVTGIPTQKAEIESPPDTWMEDNGPANRTAHRLLTVRAQVLPVMGMGQPTSERTLIEITEHDDVLPPNDEDGWRFVAEGWGRQVLDELTDKRTRLARQPNEIADTKALAIGLLTGQMPFRIVTLKQFRDAEFPEKACYQSVSEIDRTIQQVYDLREIDTRVLVRIHRYQSRPIMDSLGLVPKWTDFGGAAPIDSFQAIRPFWTKVAMHESLGCRVLWRAGQEEWLMDKHVREQKSVFASDPALRHSPVVGRSLVKAIELVKPRRLRDRVAAWNASKPRPERITAPQARAAIEANGPQLAIESILSSEWERWGDSRWWSAYQEMQRRLNKELSDELEQHVPEQELATARAWLKKLEDLLIPGRPEILPEVEEMLKVGDDIFALMKQVKELYGQMEKLRDEAQKDTDVTAGCAKIEARFEEVREPMEQAFGKFTLGKFDPEAILIENPLKPLIRAARARWKKGKTDIMLRLSKVAQPPETFMRSDLLGSESERRLTSHGQGPERRWYVGPELAAVMITPEDVRSEHEADEQMEVLAAPRRTSRAKAKQATTAAAPTAAEGKSGAKSAAKDSRSKSTSRSRPATSKKVDG